MGADKLLPRLGVDPESPEGKAAVSRRREIFKRTCLPNLQPTRGAHELVEALFNDGLTLLEQFFKARTSSDDAERSKPDPDIVHAALDECGCEAKSAIMVGDTPYDVDAARGVGVRIVALRSGGWSDRDLRGAAAVFEDPQDLLDHLALLFEPRVTAPSA